MEQEDIDKGERYNSAICPIARAIKRVIGDKLVYVNIDFVRVYDLRKLDFPDRYYLSGNAIKFMRNFDEGLPVKPIEFELIHWRFIRRNAQ